MLACIGALFMAVVLESKAFSEMPVDLDVYVRGGEHVLSGTDNLYRDFSGVLPFTYPPIAAVLFISTLAVPKTLQPLALALTSVMCFVGISALWWHHTLGKVRPNLAWWVFPAAVTAATLLQPIHATYYFGQVNLILGLALTVAVFSTNPWVRGVLIGTAMSIKLTPGVFFLWLIVTKRFKAAAITLGTFVTLTVIGFAALPESSMAYWGGKGFNHSRVGAPGQPSNQSLNGFVWRIFGEGGNSFVWICLAGATMLTCLYLAKRLHDHGHTPASGAVIAFSALLCSPISWLHHWIWFWPALLIAVGTYYKHQTSGNESAAKFSKRLAIGIGFIVVSRIVWLSPFTVDPNVFGMLLRQTFNCTVMMTAFVFLYWTWKVLLPKNESVEAPDAEPVEARRT